MAATLLLDRSAWDLVVDANGNIAVATDPYSQAQDAASAIKTFQGEGWYDTTVGVPYWSQILGRLPPLSLIKSVLTAQALSVPGVVAAQVFVSAVDDTNRTLTGQVQIFDASGSILAATGF